MRLGFISQNEFQFLLRDPQARAILEAYSNCYTQWANNLIPLLKLNDGQLHSPLSDSNPLSSILLPLLYPPAQIRGKTSFDCLTVKKVLQPVLGLDIILENFVPVIPLSNSDMKQELLKKLANENSEVCENYRRRLECIIQFQSLSIFKKTPVLYIGGIVARIGCAGLIGDAVVENTPIHRVIGRGISNTFAVIGMHPTAAKMNGNKKTTSDAIRFGLNLALSVSKTLKQGKDIATVQDQLAIEDQNHVKLVTGNMTWWDTKFGAGASANAKKQMSSIHHLDLTPLKALYDSAKEYTDDNTTLFKVCTACVVSDDLLDGARQLFTHFQFGGLKLWLVDSVRSVLSQQSIVPRLLADYKELCTRFGAESAFMMMRGSLIVKMAQGSIIPRLDTVVQGIGQAPALHLFKLDSFTSLSDVKQANVLQKFGSLRAIMNDATAMVIMNASLICAVDEIWPHVQSLLDEFSPEFVAKIVTNSLTSALSKDHTEIFAFIRGVGDDRAGVYLNHNGCAAAIKKKGWAASLNVFNSAENPQLSRNQFLHMLR